MGNKYSELEKRMGFQDEEDIDIKGFFISFIPLFIAGSIIALTLYFIR